jgi:hypothetical protein
VIGRVAAPAGVFGDPPQTEYKKFREQAVADSLG